MIHIKPLAEADQATLKELKSNVQEAIKLSQIPFDTFNKFAEHLIRSYFKVPDGTAVNVTDYELSSGSDYIVHYDNQARVL